MAKQKTVEQLLAEVEATIRKRIEKLLNGLTKKQRLEIINNPDLLDKLLQDIDPDKIAQYYQIGLTQTAGTIIKSYAEQLTKQQKQKVGFFVDNLVKLKTKTLRNFIISNKDNFKTKIIEFAINGSRGEVIKNYFEKTPFTNSQIGTLLNTAESDIRRTTIISGYEDRKDQRFRYEGGVIPTSSDTCAWLMDNQDPEGYTMDEIQAGIETPYGIVDAGGRVPNYNCLHVWEPIL